MRGTRFPRVPRGSERPRSTGGYNPTPRWGVQDRQRREDGGLHAAVCQHPPREGAVVGGLQRDGGGARM